MLFLEVCFKIKQNKKNDLELIQKSCSYMYVSLQEYKIDVHSYMINN